MTNVKLIRALESRVNEIPHSNGQFIITEQGNIYTDFPNDERVFVSGVDGKTYIPQVDNNYNLTWSESGEPPANAINIKGPQGPKGDKGDPFTIAKIYSSIAEMNASYSTDGIALGSFVLINTGNVEDFENARLYIKGTSAYEYITDLSGTQGIQGPPGTNGTSVTITNITESATDGGNNVITFSNGQTMVIKNGSKGSQGEGTDGKSAYLYAKEAGYTGTEQQFANRLAETPYKISVKEYGAKGDGSTDDTAAFKNALTANRTVYVPGGKYILSDTILIGDNCELELSQDTVLTFTQTDKHGIEMRRLANLRGNHATIFVPYAFTKNVIHAATDVDTAGGNNSNVPPFTTWDPQWKYSRYVTDINICKKDSAGFCYSTRGECSGTGIYIGCDVGDQPATYYMWGVSMSGVRIQGAFTNGIHVKNVGAAAWNHDMRLEAVIDACETGVLLERTNIAHIAVTFQPRLSRLTADGKTEGTKVSYAKWGIKMVDSKWVDLTQSTIWDWHLSLGAGQTADQSEYQHIAMYGDCTGLILGDFLYHIDSRDIRDIIYSENDIEYPGTKVSNLATMTILQEPITRWFKTIDGAPYYFDGSGYEPLTTSKEFGSCFATEKIELFTNALPTATDLDGSIYNGTGYRAGYRLSGDGSVITAADNTYTLTGFIPVTVGQTVYVKGMFLDRYDDVCRFYLYDANKNPLQHGNYGAFSNVENLLTGASPLISGTKTEEGFQFSIKNTSTIAATAYIRFNIYTNQIGDYPVVSVGNPIEYSQVGALAETIKVTDNNIVSNKLNILQTKVDSVTQNVTENIDKLEQNIDERFSELEQNVDERLENLSIGPSQTNFIKTGENWEEQEPKFNLANIEYKENTYYNDKITNGDDSVKGKVPTELTYNNTLLIKPIYDDKFNPVLGSTLRIRGINFNDTASSKSRVYVIWKSDGTIVDVYNMGSKISESLQGVSPNKDFSYIWDEATKTLEITFTHTGYRDPTQYWNYVFSGKLADGYTPETVIVTLDPIEYETVIKGKPMHLSDLIYAQNVFLTSPSGNIFKLVVSDDGLLTTTAFTE